MRALRNFRLSLRLLARDWRAGELRIFAAALVIAVGAVTAVGFFNDRVTRGLAYQSAELLGADLVLLSPQPVTPDWLARAADYGLAHSEILEFSSVAIRDDRLQLSSIRAVDKNYPVRGAVRTSGVLYAPDSVTREIPAPGTVWVEARVMHALALELGQYLEVGSARFKVTRVLTHEPGRGGNFFGIAPRVLMNRADVVATGVIQPGSRVTYGYGFAGAETGIQKYREWLKTRLGPSHQLIDVRDGNATIARAIERVERYIGLTSLLAVILAGVAIAMGAHRYSRRHYDMSALLRCFGASQRDVVQLYLPPLFVLGVIASGAGCLLGWVAQEVIHFLMQDFFPVRLPPPGFAPVIFGVLTGLITLAGFAVVPVLRLKNVPPLRVLRRELTPLPASAWAVYGAAAAAVIVLMWRYTHSWVLTLSVLAGALAAAAVLAALAWGLLRATRRLHLHVGVAWRFADGTKARAARQGWRVCGFGFNNLWRRTQASVGQTLAFGLTLMAMALMTLVRSDLLSTWQGQLPADTPNHFAFNILPQDVAPMQRFFAANAVPAQALYPLVRGRLTAINDVPVTLAVTKEETGNEAIQRELNLTWTDILPPDNTLVRGAWWASAGSAGDVSVEEKLANKLGIALGDALTFSVAGAPLQARVASIRKVQWESFHPNFYMIFPRGALDAYPTTYLTSFYLAPDRKPLLTALVRAFPAVTVLETDQVLTQVRTILTQVTAAVEFVLLFVLAAGFAVLYAALAASLDERFHEGALWRALGASRRQLRAAQLAEFTVLGVLAGVLAAIGTELIAWLIYTRVFELDYHPKWPVWLIAPLAGGLLIGLAGYLGTRRVVRQSPMTVLREL
jgi:putative ABC transport system permease protein